MRLGVLVIASLALQLAAHPVAAAAPIHPHVMVIVEENREESDVIGSPDAPYITQLAHTYGFATNAFAQAHPSLPNYLELISGSTFGVSDDGTTYRFDGPTLADQLSAAGYSWRAYMEGMPSPCYRDDASGRYAKKHNPFMYFNSITGNPSSCANVVPFTSFTHDIAAPSPPDFVWVTPDVCNDGHDCSTSTADAWLKRTLAEVVQSSWFHDNGVVIVTWDEGSGNGGCCNGAAGGHVATIVVAQPAQQAALHAAVDHAGTLRSIEELYGVSLLRDAACACSGSLAALLPPTLRPLVLSWATVPRFR
ncbi:MAG: alkaline phosphatase family protein [Candidatus Dormibacteria bacterium]